MTEVPSQLRRAFRYLKGGVFPPDRVDEFTCGRGAEFSVIEHCLAEVKLGGARHTFLEATYGQGKSHMLKSIEAIALRMGFAVSWITLDGYNHAFNHPTRYFHALLENLRVPGVQVKGLSAIVDYWLNNDEGTALRAWSGKSDQWWLAHPIRARSDGRELSALEASHTTTLLESRDIQHRSGKAWFDQVSDRIDDTTALCRAAGLNGLVFLFDEIETVATLLSSTRQRYLAYEFLNTLIDGRKHPNCFFVFAATPDFTSRLLEDKEHLDWYRAEYEQGCRFIQKWMESTVFALRLGNLSRKEKLRYGQFLRASHGIAYGWAPNQRLPDEVLERMIDVSSRSDMSIREVVKGLVQLLDVLQQEPALVLPSDYPAGHSESSEKAAALAAELEFGKRFLPGTKNPRYFDHLERLKALKASV